MIDVKKVQEQFKSLDLDGWLEDWDIKNIYEKVSEMTAGDVYVEIGVAFGKSMAVANLAAKGSVGLYGIDVIDQGRARDDKIKKFLEFYDKVPRWEFYLGDSQYHAKYWQRKINILFIDGDHEYEGVMKDIASWIPHVGYGGTIMFDDYSDKAGVKRAVDEVIKDFVSYTEHKVDNEMYLCKKL